MSDTSSIQQNILSNLSKYDSDFVDMYHWQQCRDVYNRLLLGVTGGLCNRLISMWWWRDWCVKHNRGLSVLWKIAPSCPGALNDIFTEQCMSDVHRYQTDYWIPNVCDVSWAPATSEYPHAAWPVPSDGWPTHDNMRDIVCLQPQIKQLLQVLIEQTNKQFVAVHVRRTDHVKSAVEHDRHVTDQQYIDWLNQHVNDQTTRYVATDNQETFDIFHDRFHMNMIQHRFECLESIDSSASARHTSLEQSIVDMMMCVLADQFMGNSWSTFTYFIQQMRHDRDHWIDHVTEHK